MNKESLCGLPSIVNLMDENLAINIIDFIGNPVMSELQLNQAKLIETIKLSSKFHYDTKLSLIKFKEKADRNILIIRHFLTTADDRTAKEEFIKKIISNCNGNYINKIKKIDFVADSIHVVFQHEDFSMEVEKYLNNLIQGKETSDEFSQLYKADICLAAESLKRRVLSNLVQNSLWKQIQIINKSIGSFVQRRYTEADRSHINLKRDTEDRKQHLKTNSKRSTYTKNTYQHLDYSKHSSYRDTVMSESNDIHMANKLFNNFSNKHQRNSKVLQNKFDIVQEQYFAAPNNYHSNIQMNSRKVSVRGSGVADLIRVPLNKEYEVDFELLKERETKTESCNICNDFNLAIKLSYTTKEIVSVYHHMNFLKKFDLPSDLQENFMSGVMLENAKSTLESFRIKKLSTVEPRDRSRTLNNMGNKRCRLN